MERAGREREAGRGKHVVDDGGQVSGPLTPASIRALQRSAGNAAVGRVAQRLLQCDPKTKRRPKAAPAKPVLDDAAVARDYADALKYVDDFYEGVHAALELHDKVREDAQRNYEKFGELQDPPSLAEEIVKAVFSFAMSQVPGWTLIEKGLEIGLFASELSKLKLELDEYPIPGYNVADEEARGPRGAGQGHVRGAEGGRRRHEMGPAGGRRQEAARRHARGGHEAARPEGRDRRAAG